MSACFEKRDKHKKLNKGQWYHLSPCIDFKTWLLNMLSINKLFFLLLVSSLELHPHIIISQLCSLSHAEKYHLQYDTLVFNSTASVTVNRLANLSVEQLNSAYLSLPKTVCGRHQNGPPAASYLHQKPGIISHALSCLRPFSLF